MASKVTLRGRMAIIAGPTVGKTSLASARPDLFVDLEELIKEKFPFWFERDKRKAMPQVEQDALSSEIAAHASRIVQPGQVLLTSLYGPSFRGGLDPELLRKEKFPLAVFRKVSSDICDLSKKRDRGSGIPLQLAEKWTSAAKKYGPQEADKVIWIPKDSGLSDLLTIVDGSGKVLYEPSKLEKTLPGDKPSRLAHGDASSEASRRDLDIPPSSVSESGSQAGGKNG